MTKHFSLFVLFICILATSNGQQKNIHYLLQTEGGYNGPDHTPFWLRSNQSGTTPPQGIYAGLLAGAKKDYRKDINRNFDWGFGVSAKFYAGNPSDIYLIEAYGKVRYGIIQLKGGRSKDITGLCDTILTSGSWSISGNAPGIPNVEISIPEFYTLPILGNLFAFKGNYLHGWMGNWYIDDHYISNTRSYLHQKSLYGRFGKEQWRLKLYGGFNHQVIWGQEKNIFNEDYNLSGLESFVYVNIGKQFTYDSIARTRVGNHLGSIDIGLTYDLNRFRLFIYRQSLYDAGALYKGVNLLDGLNGISITNKSDSHRKIHWKKFLVEFLYTKNQAGETWSRSTTTPFEDYYNNAFYRGGWSYKGFCLGNPFISPSYTLRNELPHNEYYYFSNNRVAALHLALNFELYQWNFIGFLSYSKNYGTYYTSSDGKIYQGENTGAIHGIFPVTEQYSTYLNARKQMNHNFILSFTAAMDYGDLYYNSVGIRCSLIKVF